MALPLLSVIQVNSVLYNSAVGLQILSYTIVQLDTLQLPCQYGYLFSEKLKILLKGSIFRHKFFYSKIQCLLIPYR